MTGPPSGSRLTALLDAVLALGTDLDPCGTLRRLVAGAVSLTGAASAVVRTVRPAPDGATEVRAGADPAGAGDRLRVPVRADDEEFGELVLTGRPGGRPFTVEDEQLARVLAEQAGIALGNARLHEAARQRERWIEGTAAVTTALLAGEDAGADALTTVAERARRLADAAAGVVLRPTGEGGMEIVTVSTPDDPAGIVGTAIAPDAPVLAQLLGGEPVFLEDSATDPRMTTGVRHRYGPSMMLPLEADGRLIGTLALPRRRGERPYTDVERQLAVPFAAQAALALVLADAHRGRARLAVYEDRDRIARDLHDLVVQRLFATGMMLESTRRRTDAEDVGALLDRAVDDLRSTVREVRTAIIALRQPPAGPPAGLRARVLREAAGAAAHLGSPPSTHFAGPVEHRVPDEVADRLVAAVREALAAALRQPGTDRVRIVVDATATGPDGRAAVRLTVADDGTGTAYTWQEPL
ncbi:GAF domain-containing protein [Streptomyces griseoviridis]|uniref:Signal transduction histidine kinase n=1 Tax=Streptomyces griseoviridis TaxID=45398 RepID=A0ABT9LD19_STRGD|nr:GAF domain-containing protein [Streptomyces griseoviridis]MDP9681612.1 signal transduction histidine kinase [Streptomyces griseoviridis]GGS73285.1 histidine kinase [Streptomyces griseoviridis]